MYRAGVRAILSQLAREGRLAIVEKFEVEAPKTKLVADKLKQMGMESVLLLRTIWTSPCTCSRTSRALLSWNRSRRSSIAGLFRQGSNDARRLARLRRCCHESRASA